MRYTNSKGQKRDRVSSVEAYKKLAAYEDAEEQGRLVMLPVSDGGYIYSAANFPDGSIQRSRVDCECNLTLVHNDGSEYGCWSGLSVDSLKKLIDEGEFYLTREDAEAALNACEPIAIRCNEYKSAGEPELPY